MAAIQLAVATILKLSFSYLILFLFEAVHQQQFSVAYIYCAVLSLIWYVSQLTEHIYGHYTFLMAPRIKAVLSMFLYLKVSTLTSSVLKSQYMGTVTNLIANDLSALDERASSLMFLLPFFITTAGTSLIVVNKVGWGGMIAVALILMIVPITHFISKANESILSNLT